MEDKIGHRPWRSPSSAPLRAELGRTLAFGAIPANP
jgi:hypothetical protein